MRAMTQEKLDERYRRVSGCRFDSGVPSWENHEKTKEKDTIDQMHLMERHNKNQVWAGRMSRVGTIACLSTMISFGAGMISVPLVDKEPQKNPITVTFGSICALSLVASWGSVLEMERLERSNRRIVKSLNKWNRLKPSEKKKVKERELYSVHQGLSGFLETFQYT